MDKEPLIKTIRREVERACKEVTTQIAPLGFSRTKKMFWTREHPLTIDFIHFHRSGISYGAPTNASVDFRVEFGIRVLNDSFDSLALNGPQSDAGRLREGRYHLRFNAKTGSTYDRCVSDLVRFINEHGEPWFLRFEEVENLLTLTDTPLEQEARDSLRMAMDGQIDSDRVAISLRLLGIEETGS